MTTKVPEKWIQLFRSLMCSYWKCADAMFSKETLAEIRTSVNVGGEDSEPFFSGDVSEGLNPYSLPFPHQNDFESHCRRIGIVFRHLCQLISHSDVAVIHLPTAELVRIIRCALVTDYVSGQLNSHSSKIIFGAMDLLKTVLQVAKGPIIPFAKILSTEILNCLIFVSDVQSWDCSSLIAVLYYSMECLILQFGPATNLQNSAERLWSTIENHLKKGESASRTSHIQLDSGPHSKKRRKQMKRWGQEETASVKFQEANRDLETCVNCCQFLKTLVTCLAPLIPSGFYVDVQRFVAKEALKLCVSNSVNDIRSDSKVALVDLFGTFLSVCVPGVAQPLQIGASVFAKLRSDRDREMQKLATRYASVAASLLRPRVPSLEPVTCYIPPVGKPPILAPPVLSKEALDRQSSDDSSKKRNVVTHVVNIDEESSSESGSEDPSGKNLLSSYASPRDQVSSADDSSVVAGECVQSLEIPILEQDLDPEIICVDSVSPPPKMPRIEQKDVLGKKQLNSLEIDTGEISKQSAVPLSVEHMMLQEFSAD